MKHIFIILLCGLLLASCSPQKRLARLVENHPELVKTDTVFTTVTIPADTVTVERTVTLQADTAEIRAITDSLFNLIGTDTVFLPNAKETAYKYLTKVVPQSVELPTDTMYVSDEDASVEIWFDGNELKGRFIRKKQDIDVPTTIHNVEPVRKRFPLWSVILVFFVGVLAGGRFVRI